MYPVNLSSTQSKLICIRSPKASSPTVVCKLSIAYRASTLLRFPELSWSSRHVRTRSRPAFRSSLLRKVWNSASREKLQRREALWRTRTSCDLSWSIFAMLLNIKRSKALCISRFFSSICIVVVIETRHTSTSSYGLLNFKLYFVIVRSSSGSEKMGVLISGFAML